MYWEGDQEYLAFGNGAAGLIENRRVKKPSSIKKY